MKRILLTALCLGLLVGGYILKPLLMPAQLGTNTSIPSVGNLPDHGPTLPVGCNVGQIYFLIAPTTNNQVGLYQATVGGATCTWSSIPAGTTATFSNLNNIYYVDGTQNTTIQSIYNLSTYNGGNIMFNLAPGQNLSYLFDIFQNRTLGTTPVVTLTTTGCAGVTSFLTGSSAKTLAVQQVQQDSGGNTLWSPITQVTETNVGAGVLCYTVTPQAYAAGGAGSGNSAGYQTIAQECTGPCSTVAPTGAGNLMLSAPTLQNATAGVPATYYLADATATRTYNFTNASSAVSGAFEPAMVPVPNNGGVTTRYTHLYVNGSGSSQMTIFPSMVGQADQITGNGRKIAVLQLSQSAPNGIPAFAVHASLIATGANPETVGRSRSFILGLIDSGNLVSLSPIQNTPIFSTGFLNVSLNAPAPPYLPQTVQTSTRYSIGQRFTDPNNLPSVWKVTTGGITGTVLNGSTAPFGTLASAPCTTVNVTSVTINNVVALCVMKGAVWASGQTYAPGTELYVSTAKDAQGNANGGYYEVIVQGAGTVSNSPSGTLCVGCSTGVLADGYNYTNLGLTIVVAPAYQIYSADQTLTFGNQYGTTAPVLDTTQTHPSGVGAPTAGTNFGPWSSCSGTSFVTAGTCGTGGGLNVFTNFKADSIAGAALPTLTAAAAALPTGWLSANAGAANMVIRLLWVTPTGISPPASGETTGIAVSANQPVKVTAPANPPPDAVGWTVDACIGTIGGCRGREILQAVDGFNIACAESGTTNFLPTSYALGMDHGAACGLGKDLYLFTILTAKPFTPIRNPSNNFFAIGAFAHQSSAGIGFFALAGANSTLSGYNSRIDALTLEMGRVLNTQEPYGTCVLDPEGQEGSGVGADNSLVELSDCAQTGVYQYSTGAQNSGSNAIHYNGQNWDYTSAGYLLADVEAPRRLSNFSAMGPLQSTPFLSLTGVWVMSTPNVNGPGSVGPQVSIDSIECEMAYDCVRVDSAPAAITNVWASSANARAAPHVVALGPWAFNVNVFNSRAAISNSPTDHECSLWNESSTLPFPGTACQSTLDQPLGFFWEGINSAGLGGQGLPMCSSDPLIGCMNGLTGGVLGTGAGTAANPSVVTLSNPAAKAGAFSCDPAATGTTCVINATGVTVNSIITVTPVTAYTGLTCNAAADTALTKQRLNAQSANTSFTINLGTFAATAECFEYTIIN